MTDRELIKHARTKWLYKPRMYTQPWLGVGSLHPRPSCRATSRVEISIMGAILEDRDQSRGNFFCSWAIFKIAQRHPAANTTCQPQVVNHISPSSQLQRHLIFSLLGNFKKEIKRGKKFSQLFCWNCQPEQKKRREKTSSFLRTTASFDRAVITVRRHRGQLKSSLVCVCVFWRTGPARRRLIGKSSCVSPPPQKKKIK